MSKRYKSRWSGVSPLGNHIEVVERGSLVQLRVNNVWQGELDRASRLLLPTPYMQQMLLALCYTHGLRRFLVIGLGTGCLPKALHAILPQARIDVVEIDSMIASLAKRYFDVPVEERNPNAPGIHIYIGDGIEYAAKTKRTYDAVFLDAFTGGEMPEGFRSKRTLWHLRNRLAPGGLLTMNLSRLDWFAFDEMYGHLTSLLSEPAVYDPKNHLRHDDLNIVLMTPLSHDPARLRQRRLFLEGQRHVLDMEIDLLLQNRLSRAELKRMAHSFCPSFL